MAVNILGQRLRELLAHSGKTVSAVALEIGVNRRYLWLLESRASDWLERPAVGEAAPQPSRDLLIRLAFALELDIDGCDELLLMAGYAPLFPSARRI